MIQFRWTKAVLSLSALYWNQILWQPVSSSHRHCWRGKPTTDIHRNDCSTNFIVCRHLCRLSYSDQRTIFSGRLIVCSMYRILLDVFPQILGHHQRWLLSEVYFLCCSVQAARVNAAAILASCWSQFGKRFWTWRQISRDRYKVQDFPWRRKIVSFLCFKHTWKSSR